MRHVLGLITHARESMYGGVSFESKVEGLLGKIEVIRAQESPEVK